MWGGLWLTEYIIFLVLIIVRKYRNFYILNLLLQYFSNLHQLEQSLILLEDRCVNNVVKGQEEEGTVFL